MRNRPLLILLLFIAVATQAQKYGNEWINFSQQYFKIPVVKEGLYRIDSTTLSKYYNLSATNPKNFQLFLKGKEQFLHIEGENDGQIDGDDYIEFYANPFMGDIDSLLYSDIKYTPNPYLPIYSDTLHAFITLNTSVSNKRYTPETDTASAAYPWADHFYTEKIFTVYGAYNSVDEYSSGLSDPHLTQAEGKGANIGLGISYAFPASGLNTYTTSPLPFYVTVNYSGASKAANYSPDHKVQLYYSDQNNTDVLVADTSFHGYIPVRKKFVINSQNTNNTTSVTMSCVALPSFTNTNTLINWHYTHYFYPHTNDLNGSTFFRMTVDNSASTKSFYNFANVNTAGASSVILLDITNGKRIETVINGSHVRAVIPNGSGKTECVMTVETATIAVNSLRSVNQTGIFTNYKNFTANKPYVLIYHKKLATTAQAYKLYRQNATGGGYNVIDADVETLYEQFSYGIPNHPVSIRNFIRYLADSLANKPKYVFLFGKALGTDALLVPQVDQSLLLVPTIGVPGCDNLLTASLNATQPYSFFPEIPIGRLSVTTETDAANYLAKVQKHEEPSQGEDWKKQVMHFAGGGDEYLLDQISTYMNGYEEIISDTLFGANVMTVKKNTTAPVQNNISDSVKNVINRGVSLINFFGHGSITGFDQAVDNPDLYNNKDRYPFVIANSCYSGNLHDGQRSVSEHFVTAKQKGSIGFLATPSYGIPWYLNKFTASFYTALSKTHYNQPIGDIIKEAAFQNAFDADILTRITAFDMTLSGDPAITISANLRPDYQIFPFNITFDLKKYTDSIGLKIKYKNLGKAVSDSFAIRLERFFPNGDSTTIVKTVKAAAYLDSMAYYFPLDFNRGIGLNKFNVKLDANLEINELSEANNTTGQIDLFIPGGDILPVYPYKYAIVPKTPTLILKASTTDPFAPSTTYRFQLDTCDKFTSLISTTLISSTGGVLEWPVNLPYGDSTVYFWRISRDSVSAQKTFVWRESSFQTIGNKRGWGQAQFHQFKTDQYQYVSYQKDQRKFMFYNNEHKVQCRTGHSPAVKLEEMNFYFDAIKLEGWPSGFDGWNFAIFDSISGQPDHIFSSNYPNTGPGTYNNCIEHGERYVYTFGDVTACGSPPTWKTDMQNFLNAIPPNQYVLGYTTGKNAPAYSQVSTYNNSLYTAFESVGAKIRNIPDSVPYIFFGKKGMSAGQAHSVEGVNKKSVIFLDDSIRTRWNSGYIASEVIGPSLKWNSLHWRTKSLDQSAGDLTVLKVVGIRIDGAMDTLATFIQDSSDVMALSAYANAAAYPFLKLIAFMGDNIHRTSPQLQRWQVLYDEAPECALNPLKGFASINDTLQEGDEVTFRFPIENIGVKDFTDSLVVTYWIENKDLVKYPLPSKLKAAPFATGRVIVDTIKINTLQFKGDNALWVFVNPLNDSRYQHEQSQFNNIGRYPFKVSGDITNPLLDVTFDGVRILNGDIVSARPNILITLKDENKFLALNDTGAFTISLLAPGQGQQQRVYFGEQLVFTPANLPKNSCSISYNPTFATDGRYTLFVQAKDRSRNASAAREYMIQFEIDNHPSVTHVLNYPNPFTTSTRFVFTLTGSEVPEIFTIQIMTITGKIVREITRGELGNLHIGRNITEYAWDGRDNYGDRLANGVYLYRVITKLNGNTMEKNTSGADKYFTKEFGKMVLMR